VPFRSRAQLDEGGFQEIYGYFIKNPLNISVFEYRLQDSYS